MISKNELKYFSGLLKKKFREKEQKFIAEGERIVEEGLKSNFKCEKIIATHDFYEKKENILDELITDKNLLSIIKIQEFKKISDTVNSQGIMAVFQIPHKDNQLEKIETNQVVCLENIADPGNVGTILRNCDWFGIDTIILLKGCAEVYNPKTIRASMGAIFHLNIFNEIEFNSLASLKLKGYKILTADLNGENISSFKFPTKSIIIFSNEASGPSQNLLNISDYLITIPRYGNAESLNVASASAVILNHAKNYN
ncbi:MAG: RNA methyltransferase [Ignavibacteriaceae bacterium]